MAIRAGMSNLITRVRRLANAGTQEFTIDGTYYFDDQVIQDILDSNQQLLVDSPLSWRPQTIGGGTINYLIAQSQYRDLEEVDSGTTRWIVRTSTGSQVGTANYTPNYQTGLITFSSDQGGSAYYLTAYTYDLYRAAADVWRERLANFADWYNFSSNSQSFSREQAFEHAQEMIKEMERKAGSNEVAAAGGDVRSSVFVRTDIMYHGR